MSEITIHTNLLQIIDDEIARSTKKHGPLRSAHEAYAVILEEMDEANEAIGRLEHFINAFWNCVKRDACTKDQTQAIYENAINAAVELVQVAAMAEKFMQQEAQR